MKLKKEVAFPLVMSNKTGAKVKIYRQANRGKWVRYTLSWHNGEKRVTESLSDLNKATDRANQILDDLLAGRVDMAEVPRSELGYYLLCKDRLAGVPLMDAVEFYLSQHGSSPTVKQISVAECAEAFEAAQKRRGLSKRHTDTCCNHLKQFKEGMKKPMCQVTSNDIEHYLDSRFPSKRTRKNHRVTLVSFFGWAQEQGFLPKNGKTAAQKTAVPKVTKGDPGILNPAGLGEILKVADEKIIPFIAIGAFAGIRNAELCRLDWSSILWGERLIVLRRNETKTNRRRTAKISDNLMEWLLPYKGKSGKIVPTAKPNLFTRTAATKAGVMWPHNALRHSYISYAMALERNAAAVAEQCGNSEHEVQESYKALVTEVDAKAWFSIKPDCI